MKNKKMIPDIRFKGFSEEWEEKKLGEVADQVKSYPLSRKVETENYTGYRYIHYGDIHKKVVDIISNEKILPNIVIDEKKEYELLQKGDIIIADASEDYEGIAEPCIINTIIHDNIVSGLHTIALRLENDYPLFIYYLLKTDIFKKHGYIVGTGIKVFGISFINLVKFKAYFPSLKEQEKIGNLFSKLDNIIELQENKLENYREYKKSMLQKMFPKKDKKVPEIRFKGFSGEWEEKKLGEVAEYRNGKAHERDIDNKGKYTVVNSKFISSDGKIKKHSNTQIEPLYKNEITFVLSDVPNGKAIAKTYYIEKDNKYTLNQRIAALTCKDYINHFFMYYLINRHQYFLRFDNGVGQTNLSKNDVLKFMEKYPSLPEQEKIGSFFKNLDNIIEKQELELENYKNFKKSLLQKLFV